MVPWMSQLPIRVTLSDLQSSRRRMEVNIKEFARNKMMRIGSVNRRMMETGKRNVRQISGSYKFMGGSYKFLGCGGGTCRLQTTGSSVPKQGKDERVGRSDSEGVQRLQDAQILGRVFLY